MAMTVQTRLSRRTGSTRRRRSGGNSHVSARQTAEAVRGRARQASQSQDEALYRCQCGFVFRALVSTSVGCPHCGGVQAW
jgi:hypothetical protein